MKLMPSTEQLDHYAKMHASTTGESYLESLRFVEEFFATGGVPVHFAGADPASIELHKKIVALIEKERLAGRPMPSLEAPRRIEQEKASLDTDRARAGQVLGQGAEG